ncbi:hypothetical protein [Burkholderia ubonensis]|uniref:hypothetical protein n=1 Tax=Burkholderia ubonensis TaxID=101571 RepID=UPI000AB27A68|nr:hypothetical protein [Burkholderia ubonensis]
MSKYQKLDTLILAAIDDKPKPSRSLEFRSDQPRPPCGQWLNVKSGCVAISHRTPA